MRDVYTERAIEAVTVIDTYSSSLRSRLNMASKKKQLDELQEIYDKGEIEIKDLRRLIVMKYAKKDLIESFSYTSYYFVNTNAPLPDLTEAELGKLFKVLHSCFTHKHNTLLKTKNVKSNPLTPKYIGDVLGIKESQVYDFIKKLNKLGIIKYTIIDNNKHIMLNPIYLLNGKITPPMYSAFKEDIDKYFPLIPQEVKDLWLMESLDYGTPFSEE